MRHQFEIIARSRHSGTTTRLRYWSIREALSVERAYHDLGFDTFIQPLITTDKDAA